MAQYKFKFKYASDGLNVSGGGFVKGDTLDAATETARNGVAKDMGCVAANVVITSISIKKNLK